MRKLGLIADQLTRAVVGSAWHGPALFELLDGIDAGRAAARPLPHAHSIWEIVLHLTAWHRAVGRRLTGEKVDLEGEADWPDAPEPTQAAWVQAKEDLLRSYVELKTELERHSDEELEETVPGKQFTYYTMLHGAVQHDLYHAGQIALLMKGT